jgi:hypothetical protein
MDGKACEIIARARATVARLDNCEVKFSIDAHKRDNAFEPLRHVCPTAARTQEEETQDMTQDWSGWDSWAKWHVERGLERVASVIGEEVAQVESELLKRIRALEQKLGDLSAEAEVRRCAEVIDLPDWRKTNGSAS